MVGVVMFSIMQGASSVTLDSAFVTRTTEFGNEFIKSYEIPAVLSEEQQDALDAVIPVFFQDELPEEFRQEAQRQNEVIGERDLLDEQVSNSNNTATQSANTETTNQEPVEGVGSPSASRLTINRDAGHISQGGIVYQDVTDNSFTRGEKVRLAGKISLNKPAPYFYNVIVTCCGMNSFKAMSAIQTDPQGNYVVSFDTNRSYPLGDWTVDITTIGSNNKILKHTYNFRLLSDV